MVQITEGQYNNRWVAWGVDIKRYDIVLGCWTPHRCNSYFELHREYPVYNEEINNIWWSSVFFFPWKSKCLPWKFLSIFRFPSVIFFSFRENTLKNCPWNTRSVRENFFQITYVKMGTCVREKYNLLFPWNLAKFTFFCTREKNYLPWKLSKFRYSLPVKKKIHPWKNPKMRPWKLSTARENVGKSVRESHFSFREKNQKKAENCFHGHFWFSRKKNAD